MAAGKYQKWLHPDNLTLLAAWARDGLTIEQIAQKMGISRSTLNDWIKKHPDISDTLKKGREIADVKMENALYERGLGGIRKVKKTFKLKETYYDGQGRKCEKERLEVGEDEVYIPGDTTAEIFWLKNRKPEQWRDKQEVNVESEGGVLIVNDIPKPNTSKTD